MEYLTQEELKKMLLLSYQKIEEHKEEINKINVFPVPDQDTGSNMAKTLLGVKEAIENRNFKDLDEISEATLDGALTAAQGNAGVIYVGFLAGFLPLLDKNPVDAKKLAIAFEKGAERARQSIQNPVEGTILDVIDATYQTFKKEAEKEKDLVKIFKVATEKAKEALLATREKMEIFRKANVVDAGGLAYLMILESHLEALEGEKKEEKKEEKPSEKVRRFVQTLSYRYEVVSLIKNPKFDEKTIREKLKRLGDSLDMVQIGDKLKIHIHTDLPDEVKKIMREAGQVLSLREEDMAKEVVGEESVRKVSIGIVTEDINDLPQKTLERYQIEIVKTILDWPEGENMPGENIYQKMREADKRGIKTFPKTSQAVPKSYLEAFQKQLEKFNKVLCVTITSKISGCYNSACQAKEMLKAEEKGRVYILDSLQAVASQALLVLRAIEMIQEQREITEVIDKLKELIPQTHLYIIFEDPKWIEAGGRMSKSQANWVRRMKKINLHPLITIKDGVVTKGGVIFAKDMTEALFKKISKESQKARKQGKRIRVIIGHADNPEGAEKLRKLLKEIKAEVPFISLGSPVVCAHTGPGTLIVAWQAI
ncbi:MAG: DegV family protein [Candidatus Nealsonbacteria bacterium]|nr:MAG: DegV family protein [Candidatus Nealsonbacteria bacterium]